MAETASSGAPRFIDFGYIDNSRGTLPSDAGKKSYPKIMNLHFGFNDRGTTKKTTVSGKNYNKLFGDKPFDVDSEYWTHQSIFLEASLGLSLSEYVRILPADIGAEASFRIWCEVKLANVPNYVRNSDGTYQVDGAGDKVVDNDTAEVPGALIRFIKEVYPDGMQNFSEASVVNVDDNTKLYPFVDVKGSEKGTYYDRIGLILSGMNTKDIKEKHTKAGVTPYMASIVERSENSVKYNPIKTADNTDEKFISLKEGYKDPTFGIRLSANRVLPKAWTKRKAGIYSPLEVYTYTSEIDTLLGVIADVEKDATTDANLSLTDFSAIDKVKAERHLINLITLVSTSNKDYNRIRKNLSNAVTGDNRTFIQLSKSTPIYLENGSDGTMSRSNFEAGVRDYLRKYGSENSVLLNPLKNPESLITDSGWKSETKDVFVEFLKYKKNACVIGTPYAYDKKNNTRLTLAESKAGINALGTKLKAVSESEEYGTPFARGLAFDGAGWDNAEEVDGLIPVTYALHLKILRAFGAANGKWDKNSIFEAGVNSYITELNMEDQEDIPETEKDDCWKVGMNYLEPTDKEGYMFSSYQTFYPDDTSGLNNLHTIFAGISCEVYAKEVWAEVEGTGSMSQEQFATMVVEKMENKTRDKFAKMVDVEFECIFDTYDDESNFSWHYATKIGVNGVYTVGLYHTEVVRKSNG